MVSGNSCRVGVVTALALLANGTSFGEVVYRVTDLGSLSATGAQSSEAFGLNDVGQVVGASTTDVTGVIHAFINMPQTEIPAITTIAGSAFYLSGRKSSVGVT